MKKVSLYIAAILSFTVVFGCGNILSAHSVKASEDVPSAEPGEEITLLPELDVDPSGVDHEGGGATFSGQDTLMPEVDLPEESPGGDTLMPEAETPDDPGNGDTLMPEVETPDDPGNGDTLMPEVETPDDPGNGGTLMPEVEIPDDPGNGGTLMPEVEIPDDPGNEDTPKSDDPGNEDTPGPDDPENEDTPGPEHRTPDNPGNTSADNGDSGDSDSTDDGVSGRSSAGSSASAGTPSGNTPVEYMPFTVIGKLAVDKNAVLRVLEKNGTSREDLSSWKTLLNRLSVSEDILVMADGGVQYELTGKDGKKISLVEEADSEGSGSAISGSPFPGYLFTRSGGQHLLKELAVRKNTDPRDVKAAALKVIREIGEVSAPDGPEARKVLSACTGLMHALPEALLLYSAGFDALEEQLGLYIFEDRLKSVKAFSMTDDTEGTSYVLGLTPEDEDASAILMTLCLNGDEVDLTVENATASLTYHHYADGAEIRLKSTGTRVPFRLSTSVLIDDEITGCSRLYLEDSEDPAAVKFSTLKAGGKRTLPMERDGRERLSLEDLAADIPGAAEKLKRMTPEEKLAFGVFFNI